MWQTFLLATVECILSISLAFSPFRAQLRVLLLLSVDWTHNASFVVCIFGYDSQSLLVLHVDADGLLQLELNLSLSLWRIFFPLILKILAMLFFQFLLFVQLCHAFLDSLNQWQPFEVPVDSLSLPL